MATIDRRIGKNGTFSYRVRVRRKGQAPQIATFDNVKEARKWAQITEGQVLEGKHFILPEAKKRTLGDLIDRYVTQVLPQKGHSSITMQNIQLRWWKAQLGHLRLVDVIPPVIAEYRDILASDPKVKRKGSTVNRYLAALSHVFTVSIKEYHWCETNPVLAIRKPKESKGRVRFLTDEERDRLLTACQTSRNPYLYTVVVLALSTGARKMELLNLRWADVDFKRKTLTFRDTKNGETRAVPLTGHALDVMIYHAQVRRIDTSLVFPNERGNKPVDIRSAWKVVLKRADITNFKFHDTRHSAASYLAMNGASLAELAEILGHKTFSMVKRYAHLSQAHTASVVARMNQAIFG
jgi:integrase